MRSLAVALLLCACRPAGLTDAAGGWTVSPLSLAFAQTAPMQSSTRALELGNVGSDIVTLAFEVEAPFFVTGTLKLEGGESRSVDLLFSPQTPGDASAVLRISGGGATRDISLTGTAAAEVCSAPPSCTTTTRNPDGTCGLAAAPDGTDCASTCLDHASCVGGACVGHTLDCSDGDACTVDTCTEGVGCAHHPLECPPSADPCQVAICQPGTGCGPIAASDGIFCGASDCTTSRVCVAGACVARPTPEGGVCLGDSPCRPPGTCTAGVCIQGPAQILVPAWTATASRRIEFSGMIDAAGNVYTVECSAICELVRRDRDGVEHLRIPASDYLGAAQFGGFILAGAFVVLADPGGSGVDVYDSTDGHLVWQRSMTALFAESFTSIALRQVLSDGLGHLVVLADVGGSGSIGALPTGTRLVDLELATGNVEWTLSWSWNGDTDAAFDGNGTLYVLNGRSENVLSAYTPGGAARWEARWASSASVSLVGVYGSTAVVIEQGVGGSLVDTSTGTVRPISLPLIVGYTAVVTPQAAALVSLQPNVGPNFLFVADLVSGSFSTHPLPSTLTTMTTGQSAAVWTSRSTLVFSRGAGVVATLEEVGLNGVPRFECQLPAATSELVSAGAGHWVHQPDAMTVQSFVVPGLEPASAGWVTWRGTTSQEGHPR